METKKKSRSRRSRKGEFACDSKNNNQNQNKCPTESMSKPKLCMLFSDASERSTSLLVITVGEDKLSDESFSIVKVPKKMESYWAPAVGVGSLGLECYIIGGIANPYATGGERRTLPRDVLICDLSCKEGIWKKGPMLNGGKPDPIVVTVKGKIFALAGYSRMWVLTREKPQNMFEVFDPKRGNCWRVLPEPPFISLYAKGIPRIRFCGHTVIGSIIYLQIADLYGNTTLYLFNVDTEKWVQYDDKISIGHNLRLVDWLRRADVTNDLMFRISENELENLSVYAYDLTRLKENEIQEYMRYSDLKYLIKGKSKYKYDNDDYVVLEDENVLTVPVFGLSGVKIPETAFDSFVTHFSGNLFALVCCHTFYDSKGIRSSRVRICTFEAASHELIVGNEIVQRCVATNNIRETDWVTPDLGSFQTWCNVPNEGHQLRMDAFHHCAQRADNAPPSLLNSESVDYGWNMTRKLTSVS